jgi:hypothetical protein
MNPADALTSDYGMYYNGCWMEHSKYGIGQISVNNSRMYLQVDHNEEAIQVKPANLKCWWPRPGAYNVEGSAVYIARRAMRNMRKSAVGNDHYFVKWGNAYAAPVMCTLRTGENQVGFAEAYKRMSTGMATSVAISRDIIIFRDTEVKGSYTVVFRGLEAGTLSDGAFDPIFSGNPLTGRVLRQLETVR